MRTQAVPSLLYVHVLCSEEMTRWDTELRSGLLLLYWKWCVAQAYHSHPGIPRTKAFAKNYGISSEAHFVIAACQRVPAISSCLHSHCRIVHQVVRGHPREVFAEPYGMPVVLANSKYSVIDVYISISIDHLTTASFHVQSST